MSFALLIVGTVMLIASMRDTHEDLFELLKGDFTGENNFIFWFVSILLIGSIGYIPKLKPLSTAFLTLVVLVLLFSKGNPKNVGGGFFNQFLTGLKSTTKPASDSSTDSGAKPLNPFGSALNDAISKLPF